MNPTSGWNVAGAWLLTYLVHSTLLLATVLCVSRWVGRRSLATEEAMWRGALLGAVLTASLQLGLGWHPWSATWQVASGAAVEPALSGHVTPAVPVHWVASEALRSRRHLKAPHGAGMASAERPTPVAPRIQEPGAAGQSSWLRAALLTYLAFAFVLFFSVLRAHQWLRRRLRTRARVVESPVVGQLSRLTQAAHFAEPVRLSCSSRLPVPVALGVQHAEICVPPRALFLLSDEEQEGLIAHELAHIVRRDLRWMLVTTLVTRVFFFQPLNWFAGRRLREISELIADEWAATRTGRPQSLARCLTEVAGWSYSLLRPLPVPGAARPGSQLQRRVRRLLEAQRMGTAPLRRTAVAILGLVAVAVMVLAAPSFGTGRRDAAMAAPPAPPAPATPATPAAPAVAASAPTPAEAPVEPEVAELDDDDAPLAALPALAPLPPSLAAKMVGQPLLMPLPPLTVPVALQMPDAEEDVELAEDEARLAKAEAELDEVDEHPEHQQGALNRAAREMARASERMTEDMNRELAALKPEMERLQKQLIRLRTDELAKQSGAMDELSESLAHLKLGLSDAEMAKLNRALSQSQSSGEMSKEIAAKVRARIDEASQAMKKYSEMASRDWGKHFQEQMDELHAARKLDFDKLHEQLRLSEDQQRKIIDESRRLAELARPTPDQLKTLRDLTRQQAELLRRTMENNRALIDATRRAIDEQADLLRQQNRREMEHARRQRELARRDRGPSPPVAPVAPPAPPAVAPPPPPLP